MSADRSVTASFFDSHPDPVLIYDDALASGWADWSWNAAIDFSGTSPVQVGQHAAKVTLGGWGGFSPAMPSGSIDTFGYTHLRFWLHGGTGSNKNLKFFTEGEGGESSRVDITAVADTWTEVTVTLSDLGNPATINRLNFFNDSPTALSMITFDEIRFEPDSSVLLPGDVNNDGQIDLADVILSLQVLVNTTDDAHHSGDVDGDGKIGSAEALYILQHVAGLRTP
jgi:hypothetical protein